MCFLYQRIPDSQHLKRKVSSPVSNWELSLKITLLWSTEVGSRRVGPFRYYVSFQFRSRQLSPLFGGYCLMFLGGVSLRRTSVGKISIESVER